MLVKRMAESIEGCRETGVEKNDKRETVLACPVSDRQPERAFNTPVDETDKSVKPQVCPFPLTDQADCMKVKSLAEHGKNYIDLKHDVCKAIAGVGIDEMTKKENSDLRVNINMVKKCAVIVHKSCGNEYFFKPILYRMSSQNCAAVVSPLFVSHLSVLKIDHDNLSENFVLCIVMICLDGAIQQQDMNFQENVSLIYSIWKNLENAGWFCLAKIVKNESNMVMSAQTSTKKLSYHEPAAVCLGVPPTTSIQSISSREITFRLIDDLPVPPYELAQCGFYWNGCYVQCYSCNSEHEIDFVAQNPKSEIWHDPSCEIPYQDYNRIQELPQAECGVPGRISDDTRDPPGQQSVYIPPGDVRMESYRLSTFNNYPGSSVDRKALASAGFYFTGYSDRVKCFACGRTVENWTPNDNPLDLKWHKLECLHPRGGDCGNIPTTRLFQRFQGGASNFFIGNETVEQRNPATSQLIGRVRHPTDLPERVRQSGSNLSRSAVSPSSSVAQQPPRQWRMANVVSADHRRFLSNLFLNRELDRLASFARWPTSRPTVSPTDLATNGFFYLGDMDRTQCFSCGGVLRNWTINDSARVEHRTHFSNCRLILGVETRNVPVPLQPETPQERQERFPCRFPSNPHMRSEAARLDTFDSRWPVRRMAATPAEIAQAGFFFLGERDRVKCWYCNGGLQHWDYEDVPWTEHAKWFPNCQFLLSVKGQHFVYHHLKTAAHLARPIIAKQDGATIDPPGETGYNNTNPPPEDIPPSLPSERQPTPPPTIVDPQEEMRKRVQKVDTAMRESDVVKNVLAMGFSSDIVSLVLKEKVESGNVGNQTDIYDSVAELLDAVMQKENEKLREDQEMAEPSLMLPHSSMMMPSMSSVYSSMTNDTNLSTLGPPPGSGKYNVSLMEDDEDIDMYGAQPMGGPGSIDSVTQAKMVRSLSGETSTASVQEALNKMEEERMCKICFTNQADMVFVPCGHMCCCRNCTEAIRHCPVCRDRIEKAIKTYLQ